MDLNSVVWQGDDRLEIFRDNWERVVTGLSGKGYREEDLFEILLDRMTRSHEMKEEITRFRRHYADQPEKYNYKTLMDAIDEQIMFKRQKSNRLQAELALARQNMGRAPTVPKAEVCQNFLRGTCTNVSCPRLHPEGMGGSARRSEVKMPARATARTREPSRQRPKPKKKQGHALPAYEPAPEPKRGLCAWFQVNSCPKSASECAYEHAMGTDAQRSQLKQVREKFGGRPGSRSRASTPKGGSGGKGSKSICSAWVAGHCQMGDMCIFSHEGPKGKGKSKKGKGKGKGKGKSKAVPATENAQ